MRCTMGIALGGTDVAAGLVNTAYRPLDEEVSLRKSSAYCKDFMLDVIAIGELLIDFTPAGKGINGMELFACNPDGAPTNVLAANSRLSGKTAFVGKAGNDHFGLF